LQGAFGRCALIEQAKGIVMARHSIDAEHASLLLLPPLAEPATTAEH
jgi:hypothetical protein